MERDCDVAVIGAGAAAIEQGDRQAAFVGHAHEAEAGIDHQRGAHHQHGVGLPARDGGRGELDGGARPTSAASGAASARACISAGDAVV